MNGGEIRSFISNCGSVSQHNIHPATLLENHFCFVCVMQELPCIIKLFFYLPMYFGRIISIFWCFAKIHIYRQCLRDVVLKSASPERIPSFLKSLTHTPVQHVAHHICVL